jgi:hypothetical protein
VIGAWQQSTDLFAAIKGYFTQQAAYLQNPATNPPVHADAALAGLEVTDLLSVTDAYSRSNPSLMTGAAGTAIDCASAIQRELNLRTRTRQAYYAEGVGGHNFDADFYDAAGVNNLAALQAKFPSQTIQRR